MIVIWDNGEHWSSHAIYFVNVPQNKIDIFTKMCDLYKETRYSDHDTDHNPRILATLESIEWREDKSLTIASWWADIEYKLYDEDDKKVIQLVTLAESIGLPRPYAWA